MFGLSMTSCFSRKCLLDYMIVRFDLVSSFCVRRSLQMYVQNWSLEVQVRCMLARGPRKMLTYNL